MNKVLTCKGSGEKEDRMRGREIDGENGVYRWVPVSVDR